VTDEPVKAPSLLASPPPHSTPRPILRHRALALGGASTGLAVFVVVALVPAGLEGGQSGVMLAAGIFGMPTASTFGLNAFIVAGMVIGAAAVAALFAVLGAVAGAAIGALTRASMARKA
jgi:hypothetical protein